MTDYIRDPAAIYRESFTRVRAATNLDGVPETMTDVVLRLVHACGMPDIVDDLVWTDGAADAGRTALAQGRPVLVDAEMVGAGVIRARLPAENRVICTLGEESVPARAKSAATTRSAAAVELWGDQLNGAVVAIGNAPTAMFRLLELIDEGAPRPALVLGFAVGFVGAAESKDALITNNFGIDYIALKGRRGGSAMAAAAVNALAGGLS